MNRPQVVKNAAWYRSRALSVVHGVLPTPFWNAMLRLRGHEIIAREPYRDANYQGVRTVHNARQLHVGRFAEIYDRWAGLNPYIDADTMRYRAYNVCQLAARCINVPGDFVSVGVSFGVVPRTVYDFAGLANTDKTFHLIDPFDGAGGDLGGTVYFYNTDPDIVVREYPADANIKIHRGYAPEALQSVTEPIAFAFLDTTHSRVDAESIARIYPRLSPGGIIVCDRYATSDGHFQTFDPVFAALDIEPFWFPSGQCAIFK